MAEEATIDRIMGGFGTDEVPQLPPGAAPPFAAPPSRRPAGARARETQINRIMEGFGVRAPDPDFDITPEQTVANILGQEKLPVGAMAPQLRALIGVLGDTFEEQQRAFSMVAPTGELRDFPSLGVTVFRMTPDEPFREIDPDFFEAFGLGVAGFGEEMKADLIADIMGDVPEILGETAAFFAFRRTGASLLGDLARLAGGAAGGETLQQLGQTAAGTQAETFEEQRRRVAGASALSLIGGTLFAFGGAAINVTRGRGLTNIPPEAMAASAAAERIGTRPLLPGQISDVPFVRLLSRQAQALLPRITRYITEQEKRTANAVRGLVDPAARSRFISQTEAAFNQAAEDIVNFAVAGVQLTETSARAAGRAIQQGITRWWNTAGTDVTNLYNTARAVEEPIFDAAPALTIAQDIKTGVMVEGAPVLQPVTTGPFAQSSQLVRDALGQQVRPRFRISELDPRFEAIVNDVLRLSPTETTTAQLRAVQHRLFDLTRPGPDGIRIGETQAIELRSAISDVLTNPTNTTPEFRRLWGLANQAAATRFTTREKLAIVDALRSERPSVLARELAKPEQLDNLVIVRRVLNQHAPDRWDRFVSAFKSDLMGDIGNITARLDAFDAPTLNVLLSRTEQRVFREAGRQIDQLASTGVQKALQNQETVRGFIREIFDTNNTASIAAFGDLVQRRGGLSSPFGQTTRAAVADEIWKRARVIEQGVEKVDFNQLQSVLADFDDRGLLRFLSADDIRVLRDAEMVQDFARLGSVDAGTSLAAASAVGTARGGGVQGFVTFVENLTVGRLITSSAGRRLLVGSGRARPTDLRFLRLLGAAATQVVADSRQQQELGEDFNRLLRATALIPGMLVEGIQERIAEF